MGEAEPPEGRPGQGVLGEALPASLWVDFIPGHSGGGGVLAVSSKPASTPLPMLALQTTGVWVPSVSGAGFLFFPA